MKEETPMAIHCQKTKRLAQLALVLGLMLLPIASSTGKGAFAEPSLDVEREIQGPPAADTVDAEFGPDWIRTQRVEFDRLEAPEIAKLQRERDLVNEIAERHLGEELSGTTADLSIAQRILDQNLLGKKRRETLLALGVAVGDVLVKQQGYQWVAYTDEKGRSRALRRPGSLRVLFPVTLISRRVDAGMRVDVAQLYAGLVDETTSRKRSE